MGVRDTIAKKLAGIKAYHSSPHDFDRFDLKKVGTGEGAQVYGHGLYFAENPAVSGQGGQYWNQFLNRFEGTPEGNAAKRLRDAGFDRDKAVADYEAYLLEHATRKRSPEAMASAQRLYEAQMAKKIPELELLRGGAPVGPRTYEVNINADPAHMLDWDKPLPAQSPNVWKALRENDLGDVVPEGRNASELVQSMQRAMGKERPSQIFGDLGIPGIKYLDEGSRNLSDKIAFLQHRIDTAATPVAESIYRGQIQKLQGRSPTSNYVVFDPSTIDILKKYGVVGAPAGALGMGALADQSQYEVQP